MRDPMTGLAEDDFELVFGAVVPTPNGGYGFMVKAQLRNPPPGQEDEALEITAPRMFATAADAEAMGHKAVAYQARTGMLPRLAEEAFYVTPEPPDRPQATDANDEAG